MVDFLNRLDVFKNTYGVLTPQQVAVYKQNWKPDAFSVLLHTDMGERARGWCNRKLNPMYWHMAQYTKLHQHTFSFEQEKHAIALKKFMQTHI